MGDLAWVIEQTTPGKPTPTPAVKKPPTTTADRVTYVSTRRKSQSKLHP